MKAAWIGAGAAILSAVIGVFAGIGIEQRIIYNQIQTTVNNNVNVDGDSNDIVINDVNSLAENYMELQTQYEELQKHNNYLLSENTRYSDELEASNKEISNLSSEKNQKIQELESKMSQMYNVDFQTISLTINGIDSGYINRTVTINNETFYSIGFLQYMVDNQAVSSDGVRLFIGEVQSEEMMPVSLFELKAFTKGYLKKQQMKKILMEMYMKRLLS